MEDTLLALLRRYIHERKLDLTVHTMGGGASKYEDYIRAVAQYEALTSVEEEIKDLEQRFMES
jgi:hypothetical protein